MICPQNHLIITQKQPSIKYLCFSLICCFVKVSSGAKQSVLTKISTEGDPFESDTKHPHQMPSFVLCSFDAHNSFHKSLELLEGMNLSSESSNK